MEIVERKIPAPHGDPTRPLRAIVFDSQFDAYRGTIVHFRVFQGRIETGDTIRARQSVRTTKQRGAFIQQLHQAWFACQALGHLRFRQRDDAQHLIRRQVSRRAP